MTIIKSKYKLNNAGMTLLELIVVILILGIVSAGAIISISSIMNANVNSCAKKLSALLDKTRLETMSRAGSIRLEITQDSGGSYYGTIINFIDGVNKEITRDNLGSASITIKAHKKSFAGIDMVTEADKAVIIFNKGSGTQKSIYERIELTASKTVNVYISETGRNYIE